MAQNNKILESFKHVFGSWNHFFNIYFQPNGILPLQFQPCNQHFLQLSSACLYTVTKMKANAERSKALVCGRSSAENVGSNPAGGMDVCLF
jgi:hypothetical protein